LVEFKLKINIKEPSDTLKKSVKMPTDAEFRARSKLRYQKHKDAIVKRNKLVGVSSLFCVFFYVAFHSEVMTGTGTYYQQSYINVAQNAAGGCTWALYTAGKLYNTTYTRVSVWIFNTTPTNATDASLAPPPAPPKQDHKSPPEAAPVDTPKKAPTPEDAPPQDSNPTDSDSETDSSSEDAPPPLDSNTNDANNNTHNSTNNATTNNATTDSDSETDSNYTVLEVVGNAVSYVCGFAGFMFMMALQQG